jgi:cell division septum initiation protein DivIVA
MTKELIDRLKDQRDRDAAEHCPDEIIALQDEAMAAFEKLISENKQLREMYAGLKKMLDNGSIHERTYSAGIELERENADLAFLAAQYKAERDALKAENERLNNLNQLAVSQSETLLKQRDALAAKMVPLTDESMSHLAAITPRRSDETMHTYGVRVGRAVEAAHGIQAKGSQQDPIDQLIETSQNLGLYDK